ncbi:cilia- and flagella-associated protein 65-like isoform X1 [Biomphalaria glabrata]|uniref:Cilia- and flagella-associated protein 65-like isoform X1 n=2 Tax=Biomphalaria glabrata TaxID=6526 RepID=A0A9U8ENI3_BIOGL|nr:cilia- and flagella-associated protein 65-like isoform X1 [Biomphalaria glabrata]
MYIYYLLIYMLFCMYIVYISKPIMPTLDITTQQALHVVSDNIKMETNTPPSMSPINPLVSDKVNYFGIEVLDKIVWKAWQHSSEYTKTLVIKNLSGKTMKLTYRAPETRFFAVDFPKPIFLSSGASHSILIAFRPLENIVYNDKITFTLKDGKNFSVILKAVLPATDISIPVNLDFQMCAVRDSVSISFDVYNTGDLDTCLLWDVQSPFVIEPVEAVLAKGSSVQFKATFKPECAYVYEVTAICEFGTEYEFSRPTIFYGIGKFPHLLACLSGVNAEAANANKSLDVETVLDFGDVPAATTVGKWVELHNLAPVRSLFKVEKVSGTKQMETSFHCSITEGIVPAMSAMRIPLSFSPHSPNSVSIDYFNVISVGNISHSEIKCIGRSIGPKVELSKSWLNFKLVQEGQKVTRTLEIINNSDVEAFFQFDIDCEESVFQLSSTSGTLAAKSTATLLIHFIPKHPINYYRRVTLLVHNQSPLFLDLLGTCHSENQQPAILRMRHILKYFTHVERGLSVIAPDQLNKFHKDGRLELDENGCLKVIQETDMADLVPNPALSNVTAIDEYFNDGVHSPVVNVIPHVSLDVCILDFGVCQNIQALAEKTVNITNHTRGKVTVQWNGDQSHIFSVSPNVLDIPPLKACSFRVTFRPNCENKLYGNELECFVYYKNLREYRLVEDITHFPPWCLTLKCLGNTFMPNNEPFYPHMSLSPPMLAFPAVNVGESSHRTIILSNTGNTPIMYDFTNSLELPKTCKTRCDAKEQKESVFAIKPNKGILKSGHQVFTVRLTPTAVQHYSQDILVRMNNNEKYDQTLHFCGSAETAQVLLDNDGAIYFQPTCVGLVTSRSYGFKNISRMPICFQWLLRSDDRKVLNVEPSSGVVLPNEWVSHRWSFRPGEEKKYLIKPTLLCHGQGLSPTSSGGKRIPHSIRVVGEGSLGNIQTDEPYLDFGGIVVGSSSTNHFTIFNNGNCSLEYKLLIDGTEEGLETGGKGIELDVMEGVLPARSKHFITATVRPTRRVTYQYAIKYQLLVPQSDMIPSSVHEPQHLLYVLAAGVYPLLYVEDIRPMGSAISLSKKNLWNLFCLDNLNAALDADPSSTELAFNTNTRPSMGKSRSQLQLTKTVMDFNFSAAPVGSEPFKVTMMFKNTGTVTCDWIFMFPKDVELEMGFWMDDGERDSDELQDIKVMENKFFEITPKKGTLKSGETCNITFQYSHSMIGTNRLPVLLKIARGREIMINFSGATVDIEKPYLHFSANKYTFNPVPIGELLSPIQVYEMYNGGAVPVKFELDLTPLNIIKRQNFDQPVFECLNPSGEILPGRTGFVEWRFSPLEAKTYMIDIPIYIHNGDTNIVTFKGIGYDKRIMGDTMPFSDDPKMLGVSAVQKAHVPGQLGFLSKERISFGNIPLLSKARQLVFISNKSKDSSIFFEWHVTSYEDIRVLNIHPIRGEIPPNEHKLCRITFTAIGNPSFYDLDLICEISDLHEYNCYKNQLSAWEAERERQMNEFIITEKDLDADRRVPHVVDIVDGPPSARLSKLNALAEGRPITTDGELSKFKTLPPIRQLTEDEKRIAERRHQKKLANLWQKPEPIKPSLLHLGITARTHDTQEFQTNFPKEYKNFFIDGTLSLENQRKRQFLAPTELNCSKSEGNIIASILGSCLRALLEDSYFIDAIKDVMQEPIPYFCQFKDYNVDKSSEQKVSSRQDSSYPDYFISSRTTILPESEFDMGKLDFPDGVQLDALSTLSGTQRHSKSNVGSDEALMKDGETEQDIKRQPEVGNVLEQILENTVLNLMFEALSSEYSVVSKPRFITMLKKASMSKTFSRLKENVSSTK